MTDQRRIAEFSKALRNARARLRRCKGCDGRSEIRRRELVGLVELLEGSIATYRSFLPAEARR